MTVTIILLTYASSPDSPRSEYARTTLATALSYIQTSHQLRLHIADDGSDPLHVAALVALAREYGQEPSVTNAERGGYGKSYNLATQRIHAETEYILPLEDDWELVRHLDLDPLIQAIEESDGKVGCIRLGYIGFTQDLRGKFVNYAGQTFLTLDEHSPERHVWTGHPRLETVRFQRNMGEWPEGLDAGTTEFIVAGRDTARRGVLWPVGFVRSYGDLFHHVGTIQAREDQVAGIHIS